MAKQSSDFSFYEFFAGGGMARAGLGANWTCLFANDFDKKKGATYARNWGDRDIVVDDIRNVDPLTLPEEPDMVWGSFPCQDLSLAGGGAGLKGDRSGTFWPFIAIIDELARDGRAPKIIALENVVGTLTSHKGKDFVAICDALHGLGYRFGAVVVDASLFVPQSRPRLFVIGVRNDLAATNAESGPQSPWHTPAIKRAYDLLPQVLKESWLWWSMPKPPERMQDFRDLIEDNPKSVKWHTASETRDLLSMMSDVNLAKVETAKLAGVRMVGGVYKRTRFHHGIKVQRAEVRFDNIAGCLRTPAGGSSRQMILVVEGEKIRSRLISSRETARLMGLPDSYKLPDGYNEAYHLTGDGVAVPVVRHLAKHLFEPIIAHAIAKEDVSAA
ncbi:MAG: DNA cytosine methyltransferase [Sphingomonas sp.]|nr:DNA cytosine methyltransferase [Sphingomonas sp.]